jgi:hypothetical protein
VHEVLTRTGEAGYTIAVIWTIICSLLCFGCVVLWFLYERFSGWYVLIWAVLTTILGFFIYILAPLSAASS